jgi:hypothetical protein
VSPNGTTHETIIALGATTGALAVMFRLRRLAKATTFIDTSCNAIARGTMTTVGTTHDFRFGLLLAATVMVAMWPRPSAAYTPEQQQACSPDAMRLCSAFIPDVDMITACMVRNRAQLSPPCRVFFSDSEERRRRRARPD